MGELHPSPTARQGNVPCDAITKGINADLGPFKASQEVWCRQCGFRCNLGRDARGVDEFSGAAITSGSLLTNGSFEDWTSGFADDWEPVNLLLSCNGTDASTTFTDTSASAHTITANGTAQVDAAQKKFGTGSLLLDGDSDYLSTSDHADWYFGTGDFTLDFWVRFNDLTNLGYFMSQYDDGDNLWQFEKSTNADGNKISFYAKATGAKANYSMTNSWSASTDTWYHIAFERTTTTAMLFIDGVSQTLTATLAFGTTDLTDIDATLQIGARNGADFINGWMDEIRIVKGEAKWTANFTPPTAAYADAVTQTTTAGYYDNDGGSSSANITRSGSDIVLSQAISSPSNFNSDYLIFGARVKSLTNGVVRLKMLINSTTHYSGYNTARQNFQGLFISIKCPSSVSVLTVSILADDSDGTAYVDNATLMRSGNPTTASVGAGCPHCGSFNYY